METNEILKHSKDISLAETPEGLKEEFCRMWPGARKGLELLKSIVKNPALKVFITVLIALGDAVASMICPK